MILDAQEIEEVIKELMNYIEGKMKYKVDRIHTLTHGPKLLNSYKDLDEGIEKSTSKDLPKS